MAGFEEKDLLEVAKAHGVSPWLLTEVIDLERSPFKRGPRGINTRLRAAIERHLVPSDSDEALPSLAADELLIDSVLLYNFRAYGGEVVFDPGTSADRPICLVIAANGHGKSSLIGALYWALHLDAGQHDAFKYPAKLLHQGATGERPEMRVEIHLHSRRLDSLVIKRTAAFRRSRGGPPVLEHDRLDVVFSVDGAHEDLHEKEAREWLALYFPPEVVRYFIFDAENSPISGISGQLGESVPIVRRQVEAVLGLTTLRNAARRCKEQAVDKWQKDGDREDPEATIRLGQARIADIRGRLREITAAREQLGPDVEADRRELDAVESELRQLRQQLADYVDPGSDDQARSVLEGLTRREGQLEERLQRMWREDLPLALLASTLARRAAATPPSTGSLEWSHGVRFALTRVANLAAEGSVSWACTPPPSREQAVAWLDEQLGALAVDAAQERPPYERWSAQARSAVQRLEPGVGAGLQKTRTELRRMRATASQPRVAPPELVSRDAALGQRRRELLEARRRREADDEALRLEAEQLAESLDEVRADQKKLYARRHKVKALRAKAALAAKLQAALAALVKSAIRRRLDIVEAEASRVLRLVTNKPTELHSVCFDRETLRFQVLSPDGSVAPPDQSTGERTIIALAILSGLQAAGDLVFPQVIEAPLRPLDEAHSAKVVREVLARPRHQSVLLEVPGRLDAEGREALRPGIGGVQRIEHRDQRSWFVSTSLDGVTDE